MKQRFILAACLLISSRINAFVIIDSVVFRKITDIHSGRSYWKLTLIEDLTRYAPTLTQVDEQLHILQTALKATHADILTGIEKHWTSDYDRLMVDFRDLKADFHELWKAYQELEKLEDGGRPSDRRAKRSLLPFIGSLTSFLFGTVSEGDLNAVKKNMNKLSNNQNELVHVIEDSLSMLNISRKEIGENRSRLNKAIRAVKELNLGLERLRNISNSQTLELEHVIRVYLQSLSAFNRAKANVAVMLRHYSILQIKLNMLSHGRLSPAVIQPKDLLYSLNQIKDKLKPPFVLPREPETNLWHYYKTLEVSTVIHEQKLIMIINIPLVNTNSQVELFKIYNLPFPGQDEFKTATAKYRISHSGLAINYGRTEYMLLSSQDVAVCSASLDSYCKLNKVKYMVGAKLHCESALFMSDLKSIQRNCQTQVFPNFLLPEPVYLEDGQWAIATRDSFKMSVGCNGPSARYVEISPPLTVVGLKESCSATSEYFTIPVRNVFNSTISVTYSPFHLRALNIRNISLWQPVRQIQVNRTSLRLPHELKSLDSFSMKHLMNRLANVRNNPATSTEEITTSWRWYAIAAGVGIAVMLLLWFIWMVKKRGLITRLRVRSPGVIEIPEEKRLEKPQEDPPIVKGTNAADTIVALN